MRDDKSGEIRLEEHNRKDEKKQSWGEALLFSHLLHVAAIMLAAVVSWLLLRSLYTSERYGS